jgi:hypothetical protein
MLTVFVGASWRTKEKLDHVWLHVIGGFIAVYGTGAIAAISEVIGHSLILARFLVSVKRISKYQATPGNWL